jgi:hypothetical protein
MSVTYTPEVGMGATICYWSDRHAATIIRVEKNGKVIVVQEDIATRTDKNGMSESQEYKYEANPNGSIHAFSIRKDGSYRLVGSKGRTGNRLSIGFRNQFYDFSF